MTADTWVDVQLARRGISDPRLLAAFRRVPREAFVPAELAEFAYDETPLPLGSGQTIEPPYVVAVALEALGLRGDERVLEVGTGAGYSAAVLGHLVAEVFSVEPSAPLADSARERLARLGVHNVQILRGDGALGWPEYAPYDAIMVTQGGPEVPRALLEQLAPGGRLVMPVGPDPDSQALVRVTREDDGFHSEPVAAAGLLPRAGEQARPIVRAPARAEAPASIRALVREAAEPLKDLSPRALDGLIERIGDARLVLLGEATHGTSEFYRLRARLSRALIERHGFRFVAAEADWPDAMRIHRYVLDEPPSAVDFTPFSRFPTWMWRNEEVSEFVEWLRGHNLAQPERSRRARFYGLDLYSMFTSIAHVLAYLERVDVDAARVARARYGALTPWQQDPAAYGRAVLVGRYASSETAVVTMLRELLEHRLDYTSEDGEQFFDAAQNALVVANAERYYRAMYYGSAESWNLRDAHMFSTLQALLAFHGPDARGIVWEHNSHLGDARFTEMSARGELNVGQLCRERFGDGVYAIGFGTDHGTVAAASGWDEPMQRMRVRPARADSYERVCHDSGVPAFLLPLRAPRREAVRDELMTPRLERAIGVVYRPETERESHYFRAVLPRQFDEYVWFDETSAVTPLRPPRGPSRELPETYPFGV